ncbi:uncharacterized protein LOC144158348 isoform X9 [Haemaphysalis longicornis]
MSMIMSFRARTARTSYIYCVQRFCVRYCNLGNQQANSAAWRAQFRKAAQEAPLHRHQPPPRNIMMHEGCVMAMSTDAVHGCGVSCSQEIQATIPTSAISTQCALLLLLKSASSQTEEDFSGTAADAVPHTCTCWPNSGDSRSFLLTPVERLGDGEGTALTAGILWATSSTPERCVTAMSVGVASGQVVSCSQKTQATVTTSARGTQCAPKLFISASSQTERKFPGCALEQFSASGDGAEVAAEGGLRTCSCHPCSGNKGCISRTSIFSS